jgi:hypothetical protein
MDSGRECEEVDCEGNGNAESGGKSVSRSTGKNVLYIVHSVEVVKVWTQFWNTP